ncbi:hypothetical protein PanWU01x14_061790 [Parasponia andersonii]|uniref:Uncharacterized protein n=1 Tax=Parasponia andersonii TaxID=3476 RepID=A0A2P5DIA2_PARAD|nr:hypothetical protein PanWU01x14_061790 [Parasponia andersonii]
MDLRRPPQGGIVVNVDSTYRSYMWAIEYRPPNEDTMPLMGGGEIIMLQVSHRVCFGKIMGI